MTPAALFSTALDMHRHGRLADAGALYRRLLAVEPGHADSLHLLGVIESQSGRLTRAERLIGRAVGLAGAAAPYRANLAVVQKETGDVVRAGASCRIALVLKPDLRDALNTLGICLQAETGPGVAAVWFDRAITIDPAYLDGRNNLGLALAASGRGGEAARGFRLAIALNPSFANAYNSLGTVSGPDAEVHFGRAFLARPDYAEAHSNAAGRMQLAGRKDLALTTALRAVVVEPAYADAYNNLGNIRAEAGLYPAAVASLRRALAIAPDSSAALNNMGNIWRDRGRPDEARRWYDAALSRGPWSAEVHSNLVMSLHYDPAVSAADILSEASRFAARLEGGPQPVTRFARAMGEPLRIGYISADFRVHPVGFFLSGVLEAHDPEAVTVTCYSNASYADSMTARLRRAAHRWRDIAGFDDSAVAALIRADGIDILVDLAGHTGGNRLPLMALRPAPLQVNWLGYFGTTGLRSVDYVLADSHVAPQGDEAYFSEKLWRLPGIYLCYTPHAPDLPVSAFPSLAGEPVTFGCFNNIAKITDDVVAAWARILRRVPSSRLFLKAKAMADPETRERLFGQFAGHGVEAGRLMWEGHSPVIEAMAAYGKVDIALDPFPFGGGTTTADTLWMGVPLVSLRGGRWTGRMSESILAALDLEEWVAPDRDTYIDLACRLAAGLEDMAPLRADLRRRMKDSPFCDSRAFTRSLEAAYRAMWDGEIAKSGGH